jgi:hypothetical protein
MSAFFFHSLAVLTGMMPGMPMIDLGTIVLAGGMAGVLDLAASGAVFLAQGVPFESLLQGIASGVLGPDAFKGGKVTAALGLLFHFLIALVAAALYYAASRKWLALIESPVAYGALYGVVVHLVMSRVVLPLSRAPKRKFAVKAFLIQLIIHILFVGLPIARIVSLS